MPAISSGVPAGAAPHFSRYIVSLSHFLSFISSKSWVINISSHVMIHSSCIATRKDDIVTQK